MIGKLTGIIDEIEEDHIILNVNNIGYVVYLTFKDINRITAIGTELTLFIEMHVREDSQKLFGFTDKIQQEWFRLLQSVHGIGTRVALAILGNSETNDLANAIINRDLDFICKTPGVGKKVAERIVTELKNKIAKFCGNIANNSIKQQFKDIKCSNAVSDAVSALVNLGYDEMKSKAIILQINEQQEGTLDNAGLIKAGLKMLAQQ